MSVDPTHIPEQPYDSDAVHRARNLLEAIPETVGPYRILERIGFGGMGEVYRAEQRTPIRREVALKLIKLGMDTRLVIARFEAERQALALMDHPHIAKVFDANADETGRPYFVMEYVKGRPITEYADHQRLSIPERLELFEQVCQAVQHAHHKGVIHRDLKPSNVLVSTQDGKPFAKVIDFGVAKAIVQRLTEKTFFTEHGQFVGTPQYMSPEQAEGSIDIDTRTDVYSLGVLLYELLTGSTPFAGDELRKAAFEQLKRMVIEVDPPKPSTRLQSLPPASGRASALRVPVQSPPGASPELMPAAEHSKHTSAAGAVPLCGWQSTPLETLARHRSTEPKKLSILVCGELDWIVMKALEKDRRRRYETPSSLATDIRSHLTGGTVIAAPPSLWYRTQKFIRKYRYPLIAASTGFFLLGAGIIGTSYGMRQAVIARRAESVVREIAELEAYVANLTLADRELEDYRFAQARRFLERCPPNRRGWEWNYMLADSHTFACEEIINGKPREWTSDGRHLVIENSSSQLEVLDLNMKRVSHPMVESKDLYGEKPVRASNRRILQVNAGEMRLWTLSGESVAKFHDDGMVIFSPDDSRLISGIDKPWGKLRDVYNNWKIPTDPPRSLKVWDDNGKQIGSGYAHSGVPAFSADGSKMLIWSGNQAHVIHLTNGEIVATLTADQGIQSGGFSPNGDFVVLQAQHTSQLWTATGELRIPYIDTTSVTFVGNRFCRTDQEKIQFVDVPGHESNVPQREVPGHLIAESRDGRKFVAKFGRALTAYDAALNPIGESIILDTGRDVKCSFYDGNDRENDHDRLILFDPGRQSGRQIATIWDVQEGSISGKIVVPYQVDDPYGFGNVSQNHVTGHLVYSGSNSNASWDRDGRQTGAVQTPRDMDCFGNSERFLLFDGDGGFIAHPTDHPFDSPAVLIAHGMKCPPVEQLIIDGVRRTIATLEPQSRSQRIQDSSGTWVATLDRNTGGRVTISLNSPGGREMTLPRENILALALNHDETRLVTSSNDGAVSFWDTATWRELIRLSNKKGQIIHLEFTADDHQLVAFFESGEIQIWDSRPYAERQKDRDAVFEARPAAAKYVQELLKSDTPTDQLKSVIENNAAFNDIQRVVALDELHWEIRAIEINAEDRFEEITTICPATIVVRRAAAAEPDSRMKPMVVAEAEGWNPVSIERVYFGDMGGLSGFAWNRLVSAVDSSEDECVRAMEAANEAAMLSPNNPIILTTLGMALYRTGRYTESVLILERAVSLPKSEPLDARWGPLSETAGRAFLTMAHARLGQTEAAQAAFEKLQSIPTDDDDDAMKNFRAEAASVLASPQ